MSKVKILVKRLCFIAIATILLAGCGQGRKKSTDGGTFANNTIVVGYMSVPPNFIIDPNTKEKSGISNDILVEIAKRNGLSIDYKEEVTWATLIQTLDLDRVDLIATPVWTTAERKARADFSIPIYFSPIGIFVRVDDHRFDEDFSKINAPNVRIAALDGEINYFIGRADFPLANLEPLPNNADVAQLFVEVQTNRKDVLFSEPMFAYFYMRSNPGIIRNIAEKNPIRNYPNAFMFKKGNSKIGEFLDAEIQKLLDDGTVDRIIEKYIPFPGAVISATDPMGVEKQ